MSSVETVQELLEMLCLKCCSLVVCCGDTEVENEITTDITYIKSRIIKIVDTLDK